MKKTSKILLTVIVVVLLGIGVSTFFKVNGSIGSDKIQLRLSAPSLLPLATSCSWDARWQSNVWRM